MKLQNENSAYYKLYLDLYINLEDLITATEQRLFSDPPDKIFQENINFFIKSYLISVCTYLEAYLQDAAHTYASNINDRLVKAQIPQNIIAYKNSKDLKDKDLIFANASVMFEKKEIADKLSSNPYKTFKLFEILGVDLKSLDKFNQHKDIIGTVVSKRNNIIHHNDKASDITLADLKSFIGIFKIYMKAIDDLLCL